MIVDADPAAGTVTIRLSTSRLLARGLVATVVGLGAPLLAERLAPALLVPALLVTVAAGWLVVRAVGRTVVIDDHGVVLAAARRSPRRTPWGDVDGLTTEDGVLAVTTIDGRVLQGPRCDDRVLARALEDAALLGLLPGRRD